MSHEAMKTKVFALHDGELPAAEHAAVERHLAGCSSCRAELAAWKESAALFFRPAPAAPSEAFVRAVMARVEALPAPESFFDRLRSYLSPPRLALAGGIAALVLSVALWTERSPGDPDAAVLHMAELIDPPSASTVAEDSSLGTSVEEYFLS